jgi:signal transduction histidine kinase
VVRSIRSYLLTRLLGGAALALASAGAGVYLVVARSLEAQFDRNLSDRVQGFASILFQVEDEVEFEFSDELMPEYERGERPEYFELWYADGRLLERSNSLGGEADGGKHLALPAPPTPAGMHWSAPLPDGRPGRYVAQAVEVHHVYPEEGPERPRAATLHVAVARGREELARAERWVLSNCVAGFLALLGLIAFVSWRAVERGLQPAERLAATLGAIRVDDLPSGLEVGELPAELAPMAHKADLLIRRVDAALQRERRTAADIAHELRTPISELVTVSEVALRNGLDAESNRRALSTVRDVAWRMGRSVATLLKLARLEMGAEVCEQEGVDLGGLVREILRSLAPLERERGVSAVNRVAPGELVLGNRDVLSIVVSNLLSNALHYSSAGGAVECWLERPDRTAGAWRFAVQNRTGALAPDDLRALTEPFWRKDGARADRDRSGLGLALSKALADETGMELSFELEGETFRALLSGGEGSPAGAEDARRAGV